MSLLTRRGSLSDASAVAALGIGAEGCRTRTAAPARLGSLADMGSASLESAGSGFVVAAKLAIEKQLPACNLVFGMGRILQGGRKTHGMVLFEAKRPEASKHPWDDHRRLADIPAEQAFRPEQEGSRNMVTS